MSTSIATFRASLQAEGHRCTVIAPRYGAGDAVEPDLHRVRARGVPLDPEDRLMNRRQLRRTLDALDAADIDVVHVQTPFVAHAVGVPWARRHGLPVVETYHTHFEEYFHHYLPFLPAGWLKAAARAISRELGVQAAAMFVGYLGRSGELQDCYAAGDLFVFASRTETQGLVLLEALALGVPVVGLAELGTREILLPERGARIAPGDPAQFAALVAELMRDSAQRTRMAAAGRAFAAEWDTASVARRLLGLYASLAPPARPEPVTPRQRVQASP